MLVPGHVNMLIPGHINMLICATGPDRIPRPLARPLARLMGQFEQAVRPVPRVPLRECQLKRASALSGARSSPLLLLAPSAAGIA